MLPAALRRYFIDLDAGRATAPMPAPVGSTSRPVASAAPGVHTLCFAEEVPDAALPTAPCAWALSPPLLAGAAHVLGEMDGRYAAGAPPPTQQNVAAMQGVITGLQAELVEQRAAHAALQQQVAALIATQARATERLEAARGAHERGASEAELVHVEVGGEVFTLGRAALAARGGLLRDIFCEGFAVPLDEDGVYHLSNPRLSREEFALVADYIQGTLPSYIGPEMAARLTSASERLFLDGLPAALAQRTYSPMAHGEALLARLGAAIGTLEARSAPQRWEVKWRYGHMDNSDLLDAHWEPFAAMLPKFGANERIYFRRPRPGPGDGTTPPQ